MCARTHTHIPAKLLFLSGTLTWEVNITATIFMTRLGGEFPLKLEDTVFHAPAPAGME